MDKALVFAVLLISVVAATEGHTQEYEPVQQQPRCWLANAGYSPGATIRSSEAVMECQADFTWHLTTKNAAGCLGQGGLHSTGATILEGWADAHVKLTCQLDGTWSIVN